MTQTAKITEILEAKEWQWKYWPMFNFNMKMDNWEYIHLNKKSKDAFKVWDEVTYKVVEPWKKWEEVRENRWGATKQAQSQEWYFTSIAFQIWFQGFNPLDSKENFKERVLASRRIFAEMMDNYSNPDKKEESKELPHSDDLPF